MLRILVLSFVIATPLLSQDLLITYKGTEHRGKLVEIGITHIYFQLEGHTTVRRFPKQTILYVVLADGRVAYADSKIDVERFWIILLTSGKKHRNVELDKVEEDFLYVSGDISIPIENIISIEINSIEFNANQTVSDAGLIPLFCGGCAAYVAAFSSAPITSVIAEAVIVYYVVSKILGRPETVRMILRPDYKYNLSQMTEEEKMKTIQEILARQNK